MMRLSGAVGDAAASDGMLGNPIASRVGSTRSPDFILGQTLSGGGVPRITQLRKCARSAFTVCVCGTGLAGKKGVPEMLPRHPGPPGGNPEPGKLGLKSPTPPPCVGLGG